MDITEDGLQWLKNCEYPGRGIVIGVTPHGRAFVQVYWIMGRSANSRNRVFELDEKKYLKTRAFDPSKTENPDLIIYNPMKNYENLHVVTNGDHTETIIEYLKQHRTFEEALSTREYEPDAPNYTPRISGILYVEGEKTHYSLSIIKTLNNKPDSLVRYFFNYVCATSGMGHCITTYRGNGNPLPSFQGEPLSMPLYNDIEENLEVYWNALNNENKISLAVKTIDKVTNQVDVVIENKQTG